MAARADRLLVSEVFASIQGEGLLLGCPAVFVRTSGCNLRCRWGDTPCDTPYTSWTPSGTKLTVAAVLARVRAERAARPHLCHAVVTGGEPLLQAAVPALVAALQADQWHVTLETNGTLTAECTPDLTSLSPKLASSTPRGLPEEAAHERQRLRPDALRFWLARGAWQLKFVVNEAADEAEIVALLAALGGPDPARVLLMPQGVGLAQLQAHGRLCAQMCLRHGWRYTPRAHLEVFGNVRGT